MMDAPKRGAGRPKAPAPAGRNITAENEAVRAHLATLPAGPRSATELHAATGLPRPALAYMLNEDPVKRRDLNAAQLDTLYLVLAPNWPECPTRNPSGS